MTEVRSKRRVLPLIFIVKSFTKSLLMAFIIIVKSVSSAYVAHFLVEDPARMSCGCFDVHTL